MARPTTKQDGIRVSLYLSKYVWEEALKYKKDGESNSAFVERILTQYVHGDLSTHSGVNNLTEHLAEGKAWKTVLAELGLFEPKEMVAFTEKYTKPIPDVPNVRKIADTKWVIRAIYNEKSYLDFKCHLVQEQLH